MNHGGGGDFASAWRQQPSAPASGPRPPLPLGLDAARAAQNILRLLEASHGAYRGARDARNAAWHRGGLVWWLFPNSGEAGGGGGACGDWKAAPFDDPRVLQQQAASVLSSPSLQSLQMADDRTALVKIQFGGQSSSSSSSSSVRYLSLLRIDPDPSQQSQARPAHDGWHIVREVIVNSSSSSSSSNPMDASVSAGSIPAIAQTLERYLAVEHGGGPQSRKEAESLFALDAGLLTVGTAPAGEAATDWTAPAGQYLCVPRTTYLDGVAAQTPHALPAAGRHDAIVSLDVAGDAASAVVHVGNGAQTTVFVDHLLLGRSSSSSSSSSSQAWKILSKTFAPREWPHVH